MPSHRHHVTHRELCISCLSAYAPAKSPLCPSCESDLYPRAASPSERLPENRRAGSDRRKHTIPVAVNLREIDRRGFLEAVEQG
jgi:hypothetical protein